MPRNAEVIRQLTILKEIEAARATGMTIDGLADLCGVTTRTIRRDLHALEEVGFPLFTEQDETGRGRWKLDGQAFKSVGAGLAVSELLALHFSRSVLEALAGAPFRDALASAFDKLEAVLTPHMRRFLDQLPRVLATKAEPHARLAAPRQDSLTRLIDASLQQRESRIVYHSRSSDRTKEYLIHPYRVAFAQGGFYVMAFVPEYGETRTFAVERITTLSVTDHRFDRPEETDADAFPNSLGVHHGEPERIEIEFRPEIAAHVRDRAWHPSQQTQDRADGTLVMELHVCDDWALRRWLLSFGPAARVLAPPALASEIREALEQAAARYKV